MDSGRRYETSTLRLCTADLRGMRRGAAGLGQLQRHLGGHRRAGTQGRYHRDKRADRTVGIFYFLWLGPHAQGGPWDITKILTIDPDAMKKTDSPLWGRCSALHHWGESLFGYYLSDDEWVLRRHAQMLADAGVDTLIFDTSNKPPTGAVSRP